MRSIFTFLFSVLFLQVASAQWKKKVVIPPPVIQCGVSIPYGSTWGEGDDFNATNFGDFVSDASNTYSGEDVIYQFEVDVESDVRVTINSMCAKGVFLMMDKGEGVLKPLASSELNPAELGLTKSFLGAVRVHPGTYFLIIDSPNEGDCEMFDIFLECTPFTPFDLCEAGGKVITCGQTISGTLPPLPPVITPIGNAPAFVPPVVPCNRNDNESIMIYQAFFDNPGTITATVSGGLDALIYSRECACLADITCLSGDGCAANQFGINQLVGAASGFYYIIVKGPADTNFDLQVVTDDCICDFARIPIIPNGPEVGADANASDNSFDNVPGGVINPYGNCYDGDRPYTGGDVAFEFEIDVTSLVTITLSSFTNAGLFLFDQHCVNDCLAMDETFGLNGRADITDFLLPPGIYTIVVDLEERHPSDWPQKVKVTATPAPRFQADLTTNTGISNTLNFSSRLVYLNDVKNRLLVQTDRIDFFHKESNCVEHRFSGGSLVGGTVSFPLYGNDLNTNEKEGYNIGEPFAVKLTENFGSSTPTSKFVDIIFSDSDKTEFQNNGTSLTLSRVSSNTTGQGVTQDIDIYPRDRGIPSKGTMANYEIFTNGTEGIGRPNTVIVWCMTAMSNGEEIPELSRQFPLRSSGTNRLMIPFPGHTADLNRTINLTLTAAGLSQNLNFTVTQYGRNSCDNDKTPPKADVAPSRGDTVKFFWPSDNFTTGNFKQLRDSIVANSPMGITLSDNCTDTLLLPLEVATSPFQKDGFQDGVPFFITLRTRDMAGNPHTFSFWIQVKTDGNNLVGQQQNRIANFINSGINTQQEDGFEIFPNPNTGVFQLKVQSKLQGQKELFIYNAFGQQVKQITRYLNSPIEYIPIDMQGFNTGIYLIQLKLDDKIISKKMILSN